MADPTLTRGGPDTFMEETLGRLSKKAGVRATIVLDRASGAILKTSGQVASVRSSTNGVGSGFSSEANNTAAGVEARGPAEEVAGLVWNFMNAAGGLVQGLDEEDELKLLRLRTKKQELVIVPNPKYLLIVIHDTPPA